MEEPEPSQAQDATHSAPAPTPTPTPPSMEQPQPPPPPLPPQSKKRPLDSTNSTSIQSSKYFKMRAVLKDLRPHFIEVLQTPNFQNSKAAAEIREHVKILMDLYRQMATETAFLGKCNTVPESQTSDGQKTRSDQTFAKPSDNKGYTSDKQRTEDSADGKLLVGGSAFGWNFITFPSNDNEPVYYGVTKETFRASQVTIQGTIT